MTQAETADGELQSAVSGDSQMRGTSPQAASDADDAAESAATKPGRRGRPRGSSRKKKLQAGLCQSATCGKTVADDVHERSKQDPVSTGQPR